MTLKYDVLDKKILISFFFLFFPNQRHGATGLKSPDTRSGSEKFRRKRSFGGY